MMSTRISSVIYFSGKFGEVTDILIMIVVIFITFPSNITRTMLVNPVEPKYDYM